MGYGDHGKMKEPCLVCGQPADQLGQCDRHSKNGILRRLEQFNPQPIEPGYLGDEIAGLMCDAAALIREQEWRDPTTAPIDGTPFQAKTNRHGYIYTCAYDAESAEWEIRLPGGEYGGSCIPDAWRPLS